MSFGGGKGKNDPLNKRIKENPRYKHIKPVVDSGSSMRKYLEQLEETRKNYKFKKDEIFRRLKPTTFAQLVLQVASVREEEEEEEVEEEEDGEESYSYSLPTYPSPPSTARSTLSELVSGVGELDISSSSTQSNGSPFHQQQLYQSSPGKDDSQEIPYLLLDVRDTEKYQQCHIITAQSYPLCMLSRSRNPYTKEMYHYKNRSGCIIILYDEDETIAPDVATKLSQRDFDNVFMLSGGMKVLYKTFPDGFLTGVVPKSCLPSPPLPSVGGHRKSSTSRSSIDIVPTTATTDTVLRDSFSNDDLLCIQRRLDDVLLASVATGSTRGSSRGSVISSRHSTTSQSTIKPWK
ncbi:PREDICTED: centrosomal protein of 41 kDa-like [Amphimedon queenslandica]|uniref:Rhodanese domain-containing protein n=1 Tax=Amphimedon queenslandica TaxID=400682 RepID=A0A1X7VR70_AMPQE|nr:PREDICTED: centrosomal protein of 41 kDa-like [Amphimedon queenslandica]XP_019855063.1 PREDICTED: centrosomal protein of 41 kDa-like [Amphimedon queenslandica]|eukprot:XP_011406179.1 PREDICTED: centrosomal protein of 41 kDa-like [Amphimedon queenslandica]